MQEPVLEYAQAGAGSDQLMVLDHPMRAAEFFAGIGLVRAALEQSGWQVVFANDIEPFKRAIYVANFGDRDFLLKDVRDVHGDDIPDIELATASFPCTDLSLAGYGRGLDGEHSSMFWEFARILEEMGTRRPPVIMLENVPSFATSKGGADLTAAVARLNDLGYTCDLMAVNARSFVPQSRERLFIVGSQSDTCDYVNDLLSPPVQPRWVERFVGAHPELHIRAVDTTPPPFTTCTLACVVEPLASDDERWWTGDRYDAFVDSMSERQADRFCYLRSLPSLTWASAYRRTREGRPVWEIRSDSVSGCLRTARGGSGKQALVEAGRGDARARWMTAREYARLQGAGDFIIPDGVSETQAMFAFGDAVCVPVVDWILRHQIEPLLARDGT